MQILRKWDKVFLFNIPGYRRVLNTDVCVRRLRFGVNYVSLSASNTQFVMIIQNLEVMCLC